MMDKGTTEGWGDLVWFQTNIAERWLERGRESVDPFAQFFFYFAGFNALYFLWSKVDDLRGPEGRQAGEGKQIQHLMNKFSPSDAAKIAAELSQQVSYFVQRRPIQRMDKRSAQRPASGPEDEGQKWKRLLEHSEYPLERLNALGQIVYLVRSNLVHGSKIEVGDDLEIVEQSVPALEVLLRRSIQLTRRLA